MELLKKCFIPVFTAILVAIANYYYIGPIKNKIEKLNEANNIIADIIIEDVKFLYKNFPKYFDIIKQKNKETGLSSEPEKNSKERNEILSSFEPCFTRLTHFVTVMPILSKDKYKMEDITTFKEEIKDFNNDFIGSTGLNDEQIEKNEGRIKKLEKDFIIAIVEVGDLLKDYISKK